MVLKEKMKKCTAFFDSLSNKLCDSYFIAESCNTDCSRYLVPFGTGDEITYYGKPELSFRVSDHWNWYSNLSKCNLEYYVQCYSHDLPWTKKRKDTGKSSPPIISPSVAIYINGAYKVVYGDIFNRKTKTWSWIESTPEEVIDKYLNCGSE